MSVRRREWDGADATGLAGELWPRPGFNPVAEPGVAEIVEAVATGGDEAVIELERRFDPGRPPGMALRVEPEALDAALGQVPVELRRAIELSIANVESASRAELEGRAVGPATNQGGGQARTVEVVERPVAAAGIYAPGGTAAYPSSVVMGCVPARVAGVERIAVATPGASGPAAAPVLAACAACGVEEVYAIGGAQAIAALALGTETIEAVDVVVGPGNRYVTEAKRLLFGTVGIDGLAGPSELAVVAGPGTDPRAVALDLVAQAEHGAESPTLVVAWERALLDRIADETETVAGEAERGLGSIDAVLAPSLEAALELCDRLAPEHLQLSFDAASTELAADRVAGCAFVGPAAATAFGDYVAGSNHVLPTGRSARFSGPLGVGAFLRRTSVVSLDAQAAAGLAPAAATLARAEGLEAHARSAEARLPDGPTPPTNG